MRQITTILLLILTLDSYSQINSREWLNIKGNVKSVRQVKYKNLNNFLVEEAGQFKKNTLNDSLLPEASDHRRFQDVIFMSIGQQLLLDNSYIEFSKEGKIEKWYECDKSGNYSNELKVYYSDYSLPIKIEIIEGQDITFQIKYNLDRNGLFEDIEVKDMKSHINVVDLSYNGL